MENNYSAKWKKRGTRQGLLRNALLKTMGYTDEDIEKPLIGIVNTWSETNPGHYNFRMLSDAVKRGVWAAGGFPLEMNTMSICEVFFDISSMVYRNLLSMTTEELIARQPFDGIVLMGSCDKNVPAQVMAAVSANKPTIYLPGGPMLPGNFRGEQLACGTDSFKLWEKYTSGEMSLDEVSKREGCLYGSIGACPIMGTANTCQTVVEALGLALPYSASSLAVSSEKMRIAEMTGRRIVKLVEEGVKPSDIITKRSVTNAIKVLMAAGGSTNLLIHLKAICRRAGIPLDLMEFDEISRKTPLLVNVKPHGKGTVGIEFRNAGGVPALMKELLPMLDGDCPTVSGKTVAENLSEVDYAYDRETIRPLDKPIATSGGIAVLKGNLAPGGAVIKRSAASPNLLRHTGEARVFDDLAAAEKYLLDDNSDMDENKVIVLRGYGPKGAPGMPEFGNYMPIPPKLSRRGIHDFVRITDSRMSGGAFGTVVLHVAPESAAGGVSRMSDPAMIKGIQNAVSIPVMAKCRIGHIAEARILEAIEIDYIDESEVLSPADDVRHIDKTKFNVPFVCGARDLGEALRRIGEGATMIRTKGEPGTGDVVQANAADAYDFTLRETVTSEIIDDVARHRSEIGILYLSSRNERALVKILRKEELRFDELFAAKPHVFVGSRHPLAKRESISLEELDAYPYITYEQGTENALYFAEEVMPSIDRKKNIRVRDRATMTNLVLGLDGFTVASGAHAKAYNSAIVSVPLALDDKIRVGIVSRFGIPLSAPAAAFVAAVHRIIGESPRRVHR